MNNNTSSQSNFKRFIAKNSTISVLTSISSILIGLLIGLFILILFNPSKSFSGLVSILSGAFVTNNSIGIAISNTAPLILVGLSVTLAYKCGLFNIGVAGQFVFGVLGTLIAALLLGLPWYLCILFGMIFGAFLGSLVGLLKAYFNVNEVISAIMINWVALYFTNEILYLSGQSPMYNSKTNSTFSVSGISVIPDFGLKSIFGNSSMSIAIILAIIIAILVNVLLNKTKIGFELKACGLNKDASKYAGINQNKNIILAMIISGALAGAAASLYYLPNINQWEPQVSYLPAIGFDGITVSLLGALNPIGNIFAAFIMSFLSRGSGTINTTYFSPEMANLIFGIIIYLCAFSTFIRTKIQNLIKKYLNIVDEDDKVNSNLDIVEMKEGDN